MGEFLTCDAESYCTLLCCSVGISFRKEKGFQFWTVTEEFLV